MENQTPGRPIIVGLAASTRRGGNSDTLLAEMLNGAEARGAKTETVFLSTLDIAPCIGCQSCQTTGECVFEDDFQKVRDLLLNADGVVLATPVYFWNLPSPAKAFVDRNQATGARKALARARGASVRPSGEPARGVLVAVAADPTPKFAGLKGTVEALFRAYEIIPWDELLVTGLFKPGDARNRRDYLDAAFALGERLAQPDSS